MNHKLTAKERERYTSLFLQFQMIAKKFQIKSDWKRLHAMTGISIYELKKILNIDWEHYSKTQFKTGDNYILEHKHCEKAIRLFLAYFNESSDFVQLQDAEFYGLYEKLCKEFKELNQEKLIEKAKNNLSVLYEQQELRNFDYESSLAESFGQPLNVLSNLCDWFQGDFALFRIKIDSLTCELELLEEEFVSGICYTTGEYDEDDEPIEVYAPLSPEQKAEYKVKISNLKKEIATWKLLQTKFFSAGDILPIDREQILREDFQEMQQSLEKIKEIRAESKKGIYREKLQKNKKRRLTVDQQKALLQVYFQKCIDKNGNLLPNHFGTGLYLLRLKVDFASRAFEWTKESLCEKYPVGKRLPTLSENSPVYQFIIKHPTVLLTSIFLCPTETERLCIEEYYTSHYGKEVLWFILDDIVNLDSKTFGQALDYLEDEFHTTISQKSADQNYMKILSEYFDILSMELPIPNYTNESADHIYRLVYDICNRSNEKYIFSKLMIEDILKELSLDSDDWKCIMYIHSYLLNHDDLSGITKFIEKSEKNKEQYDL